MTVRALSDFHYEALDIAIEKGYDGEGAVRKPRIKYRAAVSAVTSSTRTSTAATERARDLGPG